MTNKAVFTKDLANKKIHVSREFDAPLDKVWAAWTESELLDKWWAPKPWKAETKSYNFTDGGTWLYAMVSPEGEKRWSRFDFDTITAKHSFGLTSRFCDEEGVYPEGYAGMKWLDKFSATAKGTRVDIDLTFTDEAAMEKLLTMGFEGGFTMGMNNLEELLAGNN